jgi:hypothetical protein
MERDQVKHGDVGSVFARFETNFGSGEQGCIQILRVTGKTGVDWSPTVEFHYTDWLGHTCDNPRPSRISSIRLDYSEDKGEILWLKPR